MLPRALRWAYVVPIIASQLFAFFTLFEVDQDRLVGPTYVIKVVATPASEPSSDVARMLVTTSHRTGTGIAHEVTDPSDPNGHRTIIVAAEEHRSLPGRWVHSGYADFDPTKRTTVAAISSHDASDPRGYYYTFGSQSNAAAYEDGFRSLGYDTTVGRHESLLEMSVWTVGGSGLPGAASVALLVVVLAAGGVLGAPRIAGLRELSGASGGVRFVRESAALLRATSPWLGTVLASAIGLRAFNDLAQYSDFVRVNACLWILFTAPALVAQTVACWFVRHRSMVEAIRANKPSRLAVWIAASTRVPATLLVVASVFASVQAAGAASTASETRAERVAAGQAAALWVTGTLGPEVQTGRFWRDLGSFVRDATERREAFIASGGEFRVETRPDLGALPLLIVDHGYLDRQRVVGADGHRVRGTSSDIRVLVPRAVHHAWSDIAEALRGWTFRGPEGGPTPHLRAGLLQDGQHLYTYSTDSARIGPWADDAVVVVVPPASTDFSDDTYASWITSGEVLFTDAGAAETAIRRHDLERLFLAVVPVAQGAADHEHQLVGAQRAAMTAAAGAVSVAVIAASVTIVLARRRSGAGCFARFANGWSYIRANRPLILLDCGLLGAAVLAGLNTYWSARADGRGLRSALDPAVASAPAALACALLAASGIAAVSFIAGVVTNRRTIATRARDS